MTASERAALADNWASVQPAHSVHAVAEDKSTIARSICLSRSARATAIASLRDVYPSARISEIASALRRHRRQAEMQRHAIAKDQKAGAIAAGELRQEGPRGVLQLLSPVPDAAALVQYQPRLQGGGVGQHAIDPLRDAVVEDLEVLHLKAGD